MIGKRTGVCVCTPMPTIQGPNGPRLEPISVEWHRHRMGLGMPTNWNMIEINIDGKEVGEARNFAVQKCLENDPVPDYLFFLDYDVLAPFDALKKLVYRAACYPEHDIFAGVYTSKDDTPEPLIYRGQGGGAFWDWAMGDLLTTKDHGIEGVHMGLTLIRLSLFERLTHSEEKPWFLTQNSETWINKNGMSCTKCGTEDLWFCQRAIEEVGASIMVDTSVLAGHMDHKTGKVYGLPMDCAPIKRAKWLHMKDGKDDGKEEPEAELPTAIDLGFGGFRREWLGYRTYTLDIRAELKPDYCQDIRMLNLPDDEFDLVASSHTLEHFGRWEQESIWHEMARILKPGGKMEHILPNLEWAAWHVVDGSADEHTFNVLYGAQEQQGYARELNTHLFGYTPEIAKGLAEAAGMVDVKIRGYRDDPELTYNMYVTCRKPEAEEKPEPPKVEEEVIIPEIVDEAPKTE